MVHSCVPVLLLALLCGADAALKKPIRLIGVFATSPPVAPHDQVWNALVPCERIVTEGDDDCYKGGFPGVAAWMEHYSQDVRGTIKVTTPDYKSRMIFGHPLGLDLNYEIWDRLGVDFATLRAELLMTRAPDASVVENFVANMKQPMILTDLAIQDNFVYLLGLLTMWHVKVIDGVQIGVIVLWSETYLGRRGQSIPHNKLIPVVTTRLRAQGVAQIVVLRLGYAGVEDEMQQLTTYDVDVVITDVVAGTDFASNGTSVLYVSVQKDGAAAYPIVTLDLTEEVDGSKWYYSATEVSARDLPVPVTDARFAANLAWMQEQIVLSQTNNYVVATSTAVMPSINEEGFYNCRGGDCELGKMTADAMREWAGTDLAMINGGALRGVGWEKGLIKRSALWGTYPFANLLCKVNMSGTVLLDFMNRGVSALLPDGTRDKTTPIGLYPQMSGMRFTINPSLPERRVVSIDVLTPTGVYKALQKRKLYSIVLPEFIAGGGDGYGMLPTNQHDGSEGCGIDTALEVTETYLKAASIYTPSLGDRMSLNMAGSALMMTNHTKYNCTENQKYDAYWQHCEDCPEGFWNPDRDRPACVEKLPSEVDIGMILGIVFGVLALLAIPIAWKMTEKQRRINALFNNNKIAEECAIAVMDLRLGDLDYLHELEKPNTIQSAFIAITKQMKVYMEFMPKNLIANCQASGSESGSIELSRCVSSRSENAGSRESRDERSRSSSVMQAKGSHKLTTTFLRKKHITALALNSRGHLQSMNGDVLAKHSQFLEKVTTIITAHKGIAEILSGDRMLAMWNTVNDTTGQAAHSCDAALALRLVQDGVTANVGIVKGSAQFGLFGGQGTKRYDVLGSVIPSASLLMVLNKQYNTSILTAPVLQKEAGSFFYFRIVDYVCYTKMDGAACFVLELVSRKETGGEEWMYELEDANGKDPCSTLNDAWRQYIKEGKLTSSAGVTGVLAEIMAGTPPQGEYVAPSAPLSLM